MILNDSLSDSCFNTNSDQLVSIRHNIYNKFYEKNDPILCIPLLETQFAPHSFRNKRLNLKCSMDVNKMGSKIVHIIW
jgi:hypothetical protein